MFRFDVLRNDNLIFHNLVPKHTQTKNESLKNQIIFISI